MLGFKGLSAKKFGWVGVVLVAALMGGCCCGQQRCATRCGSPCEWPQGGIEMGFFPNWGCCNRGCYDPCYPFNKGGSAVSSSPSTSGDTGYLSDADAGYSDSSYY